MRACARAGAGRRPDNGFTLVELVVVLMVVGILAVAVLPRLSLLRGFDDVGYRDKVRATLEFARKAAVAQRRNVQITLTGNNLTLAIENAIPESVGAATYPRALTLPATDRGCSPATTSGICAPANVTLTGPATLTFSPVGRPSAAETYTVTGTATFTITVEAETGYVH